MIFQVIWETFYGFSSLIIITVVKLIEPVKNLLNLPKNLIFAGFGIPPIVITIGTIIFVVVKKIFFNKK